MSELPHSPNLMMCSFIIQMIIFSGELAAQAFGNHPNPPICKQKTERTILEICLLSFIFVNRIQADLSD